MDHERNLVGGIMRNDLEIHIPGKTFTEVATAQGVRVVVHCEKTGRTLFFHPSGGQQQVAEKSAPSTHRWKSTWQGKTYY